MARYVHLLDTMIDVMEDLIESRDQLFVRHIHFTSEEEDNLMQQIEQVMEDINTEYHNW